MFILQAPLPLLSSTIQLPNPELSDGEGITDEVIPRRAMNGTVRTYVKTKGGRRHTFWEFILNRPKALELRVFIRAYFASQIKVTDHNGRIWHGSFVNNPFELTSRGAARPDASTTRGESMSIRIEFEGVEQ